VVEGLAGEGFRIEAEQARQGTARKINQRTEERGKGKFTEPRQKRED